MRCLHCGLEWDALFYVDIMKDLACPPCTILAGSTVGERDAQVGWLARQDLKSTSPNRRIKPARGAISSSA